jgi:hypothetical protein
MGLRRFVAPVIAPVLLGPRNSQCRQAQPK